MTIPWEEIATVANVVASLSVFSGIWVYRLEKTDAEIYNTQRAIIKLRTNVQSLDINFRTELFSEMASATIYSESLRSIYAKLLLELNKRIKTYQTLPGKKQADFAEKAAKELIQIIGAIPTSVSTPLVLRTEDKIGDLITEALPFTPHFSGLERIARTVSHLYLHLLNKYRAVCLDLQRWALVFDSIICNEDEIQNEEQLKNILCSYLAALQSKIAEEHDQADIDTVVKIVNLVCNAYLAKNTKQLKKLKKSNISLLPFEESDTYVAQFSEAQKAFRAVFSRDEENAYSNYVKEFEINNQ